MEELFALYTVNQKKDERLAVKVTDALVYDLGMTPSIQDFYNNSAYLLKNETVEPQTERERKELESELSRVDEPRLEEITYDLFQGERVTKAAYYEHNKYNQAASLLLHTDPNMFRKVRNYLDSKEIQFDHIQKLGENIPSITNNNIVYLFQRSLDEVVKKPHDFVVKPDKSPEKLKLGMRNPV